MKRSFWFGLFLMFILGAFSQTAYSGSAAEIDAAYETTIKNLERAVPGALDSLKEAKGVLVIPGMWKFGIGLGGEYGEGALKVGNQLADYYSLVGLSFGWQLGV